MKFVKINKDELIELLVDPKSNRRIVSLTTYTILTFVAFGMTVLNIFTHKGALTLATGVFAVLCILDLVLAYKGHEILTKIATVLFSIELVGLFTFFILSGNPEGFSAIWICMVPPIGMLFFNLKNGSVFCGVMFAELVFFFWTPLGQSFLPNEYTETFLARFPLLYFAFFCLAFFIQLLRTLTWSQLDKSNKILAIQASHDQLTGLYNRQGLLEVVENHLATTRCDSFGVVIFDIDHFKRVNDTYGHTVGDIVLKRFGEILKENLNADVGRWGGEEFAAFYYNDDVTPEILNAILKKVESEVFNCKDIEIRITCSAGVSEKAHATFDDLVLLIQKADSALYVSKESGRNRVSYTAMAKNY